MLSSVFLPSKPLLCLSQNLFMASKGPKSVLNPSQKVYLKPKAFDSLVLSKKRMNLVFTSKEGSGSSCGEVTEVKECEEVKENEVKEGSDLTSKVMNGDELTEKEVEEIRLIGMEALDQILAKAKTIIPSSSDAFSHGELERNKHVVGNTLAVLGLGKVGEDANTPF